MSIKGNVFNNTTQTTAVDRVRSTLTVNANGDVSFKSQLGRGSGSPVQIPGSEFDQFVELMQTVAQQREEEAERVRTGTTSSTDTDSGTSDTVDTDSI